ncbi:MAG: peptide chain release factor N(5)-glutamine methyltransferase [Gemmatimonadetes bacterium]|nr:MAG: peptide chain release factor N(5)-glutamine methyltransferase [Gemmatimonadota bacterium]
MPDALAARRPSIAQQLALAAGRLEALGVRNGQREATSLWAAVAGVARGEVWLRRDDAPAEAVATRFWEAVQRRSSGIPFAYAVGRVAYRRLELSLDARALIPRPETEGLVDLVLQVTRDGGRGTGGVAADIGTGCGCIALSLAVEGDFDRVVAVERSPEAALLARENVALVRPATPVELRVGDLLGPLAGERFRAIVANPPYLTTAEYAALDPAVRVFEPREALESGADGLDATRALLAGAGTLLESGGVLALEIDERRADQVRALAREYGWNRTLVHEDLFGRPRYALAFAGEHR